MMMMCGLVCDDYPIPLSFVLYSVMELNNYLHEIQGPKNLVPLLHFTSEQKDPNSHIHTGTYTC